MIALPTKDLVFAIEEYRKAYMAHHNYKLYNSRYVPLVVQNHTTTWRDGAKYTVSLCDTWVDMTRPGTFSLGKVQVPNSQFSSSTLQLALEELLNFTKVYFIDDKLFNKI